MHPTDKWLAYPGGWFGPSITVTRKEDYWYPQHDLYLKPWELPVVSVNTVPTYEIQYENFPSWVPPKELSPYQILYNNGGYNWYVDAAQAENFPTDYQWKLLIQYAEEEFPLDKEARAKLFHEEFKLHYPKPEHWKKNRIMLLWMYNVAIQSGNSVPVEACEKGLQTLFPDLWEPIHEIKVRKAIFG